MKSIEPVISNFEKDETNIQPRNDSKKPFRIKKNKQKVNIPLGKPP